ncbi:MAG: hypothetical protein ACYS8X_01330 [Planctomycetota bacterium]
MTDKNHAEDDAPLSEAWWDAESGGPFILPDDVPILAPYKTVRPGFEAFVAKAFGPDVEYRNIGDGCVELCLWNIFDYGGDDPAEQDDVKQKINAMQRAVGEMSDDDRFIRIQMACFERCFHTFPKNVDQIIDGIAGGEVNLDSPISCEPPWNHILGLLRERRGHRASSIEPLDPRSLLARAYTEILASWSAFGDIECLKQVLPRHVELAETIYRRLGPPTTLKQLQVERLRFSLGHCAFFPKDFFAAFSAWEEMKKIFDALIQQELGDLDDMAGRMTEYLHVTGMCHHAFFRHIDHIVACIGKGKRVKLPGAGDEGRRIRGATTNYVHALGSWLAGRAEEETVSIWPDGKDVAAYVFERLGSPSPRKRWLAASLWKQLQDSQRDSGHGPLTDDPERFAIPEEALAIES